MIASLAIHWAGSLAMFLGYQQTYKKKILTRFASSIYAKLVNLVVEKTRRL